MLGRNDEVYSDGMPAPQRWYAAGIIATGTFMAVLDSTIANVALPSFVRTFAIDPPRSIWIINAFQLTLVATLLPLSALGDRITHRRVYQFGLIIFTFGSLCCALSRSYSELILGRIVQGIGAGGVMSISPAMYRIIFPKNLLGQGIGLSSLIVAMSAAAGPTVGGLILSVAPWPWLFAVNLPVGILDSLLAGRFLPNSNQGTRPLDIPSMLTGGLGLAVFVLGIDGLTRHSATIFSGIAVLLGFASVGYFIRRQTRIVNPLIKPALFANARFRLAVLTSWISFVAQSLALLALPFLLHESFAASPLQIGLLISIWPLTIGVIGPLAGRLSDNYSPPLLSTIGLALLSLGLALQGSVSVVHEDVFSIIWRSMICGIGFGFFQPPNNRELMGNVPPSLIGNASGVLATTRILGQTTGAALAAVLLISENLLVGAHESLLIAACFAGFATVVSATRLAVKAE